MKKGDLVHHKNYGEGIIKDIGKEFVYVYWNYFKMCCSIEISELNKI